MSVTMQSTSPISILPVELLGEAFSFSSAEDLAKILTVSKSMFSFCQNTIPHIFEKRYVCYEDFLKFQRILQCRNLNVVTIHKLASMMSSIGTLDLSNHYGRSKHFKTPAQLLVEELGHHDIELVLQRISRVFSTEYKHLTKLIFPKELGYDSRSSDDFFMRAIEVFVFPNCPALTSLHMRNMKVDATFFKFIGKNLKSLEELDLGHDRFRDIQDDSVVFIVEQLKNLRSLNLSGYVQISDVSAIAIAEKASQLTTLSLRSSNRVASITAIGVERIAQGCKLLTELDISMIPIRDSTLESIGANLTELKVLSIFHCFEYTDAGLRSLVGRCKNITSINLQGNRRITLSSIRSLVSSCKIKKLDFDFDIIPNYDTTGQFESCNSEDKSFISRLVKKRVIEKREIRVISRNPVLSPTSTKSRGPSMFLITTVFFSVLAVKALRHLRG